MTKQQVVQEQLRRIGSDFRFWGRSEVNELPNILFPEEQIVHALNGRYERGFALLCATNQRLLLLDKKPLILCMEDMRYEMISEVDYTEQLLSSTLALRTPGRTLRFNTFKIAKLRKLTNFIQEEVTYLRHPADQDNYRPQYSRLLQDALQQRNEPEEDAPNQEFPDYQERPYQRNISFNARRRVPKFTPPIEPRKQT